MQSFWKPNKRVVEAKDLAPLVREQIVIICDFSVKRGRNVAHVLGTEKMQMDVEICSRVVAKVIERLHNDGASLASSLDALNTVGGRRDYARKTLHSMSRIKRGVVSDLPEERLYLSLGDIIKVGRPMKAVGQRRSEMRYVGKDGATGVELTASFAVERKRAQEHAARHSNTADLYTSVLPNMPKDVSFGEHVKTALDSYHEQQVPPNKRR